MSELSNIQNVTSNSINTRVYTPNYSGGTLNFEGTKYGVLYEDSQSYYHNGSKNSYLVTSNGENGLAPGRHTLDPEEANIPYKLGWTVVNKGTIGVESAYIFDGEVMYIAGGSVDRVSSASLYKADDTIRSYNVKTNEFKIEAYLPKAVTRCFIVPKKAVVKQDGSCQFEGLFIMGGYENDSTSKCSTDVYYWEKGTNYVEKVNATVPRNGMFSCLVTPKGDGNHIIQHGCYQGDYVNRNRYLFNEDTLQFTTLNSISSSNYIHVANNTYINLPINDETNGEGVATHGLGGAYAPALATCTLAYKNSGTAASDFPTPYYNTNAFSGGIQAQLMYRIKDANGEYKTRFYGGYKNKTFSDVSNKAYDINWTGASVRITAVDDSASGALPQWAACACYNNELYAFGGSLYKPTGSSYGWKDDILKYGTIYPISCSPKIVNQNKGKIELRVVSLPGGSSPGNRYKGKDGYGVYTLGEEQKHKIYVEYIDPETGATKLQLLPSKDYRDENGVLITSLEYSDVMDYITFTDKGYIFAAGVSCLKLRAVTETTVPELYGDKVVELGMSRAENVYINFSHNLEKESFCDDYEWVDVGCHENLKANTYIKIDETFTIFNENKFYVYTWDQEKYYIYDTIEKKWEERTRKNLLERKWDLKSSTSGPNTRGVVVGNKQYNIDERGHFWTMDLEDDLYMEEICGVRYGIWETPLSWDYYSFTKPLSPLFVREGKVCCLLSNERVDVNSGIKSNQEIARVFLLTHTPGKPTYDIQEINFDLQDGFIDDAGTYYDEETDRVYGFFGYITKFTGENEDVVPTKITKYSNKIFYIDMKTLERHFVLDTYHTGATNSTIGKFKDKLIAIGGEHYSWYGYCAGVPVSYDIRENTFKRIDALYSYYPMHSGTEVRTYTSRDTEHITEITEDKIYAYRKVHTGDPGVYEYNTLFIYQKKEKHKKFLYEKENKIYYNNNGALELLTTSSPSKEQYSEYGDDHPDINVISNGVSVLMFVIDGDSNDKTTQITYDCTLPGETVIMDFDLTSRCTSSIKTLCSENAKFLLSTDGGSTWKTSTDGFTLKTCNIDTIKENGMSSEVLSNLAEETLNSLRNQDRIRFAIFLEQDDIKQDSFVDHITLR